MKMVGMVHPTWESVVRIGISLNYREPGDGENQIYLDQRYVDYISGGGAAVVPIVPSDDREQLEAVLDTVDGVVFSGGYDLDSALWGEPKHAESILLTRKRQEGELLLYDLVRSRGLPILGICLGIQLINVAEGGSVHQHVPDLAGGVIHQVADGRAEHEIALAEGSQLRQWLGKERVTINSYHHQNVNKVGDDLAMAACSDDGLVEAVEKPGYPFLLAVQWHPERDMDSWVSGVIRERFLAACGG